MADHFSYPRDLQGYGQNPPQAAWPGGARLALQFVLNYEEGGENCVLHGDPASEAFLSEIVGATPWIGQRHMSMESIYEYGARVGIWRLLDLFRRKDIPLTLFAVAMALERNPAVADAVLEAGHEICSHGYRWIDYRDVPLEAEREHLYKAIDIIQRVTGERPLGWYTGRTSDNTRKLLVEEGGFCMTPTPITMICPTGPGSPTKITWWCPIPSMQTTCVLQRHRDSTRASSFSPICATVSMRSTLRAPEFRG